MPVKAYLEAGQVVGTHGVAASSAYSPGVILPLCWPGSTPYIGVREGNPYTSGPASIKIWC